MSATPNGDYNKKAAVSLCAVEVPVSPLITMELDNLGTQYVKIEIHKPATSVIK